jgi:NADPH-dependent 2,4-dienoyl-CoA reductase/sulfur reductase-like enzyme/rhodanese-related sulfurtransferase
MSARGVDARRVVIVGGVAAGMSAATRLRRLDESASIVVLERGGYVSFANCGLAYYVGGIIQNRDDLLLQTPEKLAERFRLDVRINSEVIAINRRAHTVTVLDRLEGRMYEEPYDELVLAMGAGALHPDIQGSDRMLTLRSIEDLDSIVTTIDALGPDAPAVVLGAGYVGLEMVENLVARGLRVTLVHRGQHVLSTLDPEMSAPIEDHLRAVGVDLRLNNTLVSVGSGAVELEDGSIVDTELVISSIGVRPNIEIADAAGILLGASGGIAVDDRHRTNDPHIYAAGDIAEKHSDLANDDRMVALAGPANRDGRFVADAIIGAEAPSPSVLGTAILEIFGLAVASVGLTEAALLASGRDIRVIHTHPASHATYYPGAQSMALKLIADAATDAILGAQAVGGAGVDRRIDVIATAMSAGLPASRLASLELAYAPQFGSAKDPVNMLGYIAGNLRTGQERTVQWHDLAAELNAGALLVDVRTEAEFAAGSIPDAMNIPLDDLRTRLGELGRQRVIVHCQVGQRGHTAASLLRQMGIDAINLDGGYRTWVAGSRASTLEPEGSARQ